MRRTLVSVTVLAVVALIVPQALAGNPHFVGSPTATRDGDSLVVEGKVAGLGNESQIHVVVEATAKCVNRGGNKPKAANKQSVSAEGDFPVQNGKANFSLTLTPTFQPKCSPPMTVEFSNVSVTVTAGAKTLTKNFSGTF